MNRSTGRSTGRSTRTINPIDTIYIPQTNVLSRGSQSMASQSMASQTRIQDIRQKASLDLFVFARVPDNYILRPFDLSQQPSYGIQQTHQQLELLGDSLLDTVIYEYLSGQNTQNPESIRANVASNAYLGNLIVDKGLDVDIIGRGTRTREYKAHANVFEAMIGSLYLGLKEGLGRLDAYAILREWLLSTWGIQDRIDELVDTYH